MSFTPFWYRSKSSRLNITGSMQIRSIWDWEKLLHYRGFDGKPVEPIHMLNALRVLDHRKDEPVFEFGGISAAAMPLTTLDTWARQHQIMLAGMPEVAPNPAGPLFVAALGHRGISTGGLEPDDDAAMFKSIFGYERPGAAELERMGLGVPPLSGEESRPTVRIPTPPKVWHDISIDQWRAHEWDEFAAEYLKTRLVHWHLTEIRGTSRLNHTQEWLVWGDWRDMVEKLSKEFERYNLEFEAICFDRGTPNNPRPFDTLFVVRRQSICYFVYRYSGVQSSYSVKALSSLATMTAAGDSLYSALYAAAALARTAIDMDSPFPIRSKTLTFKGL